MKTVLIFSLWALSTFSLAGDDIPAIRNMIDAMVQSGKYAKEFGAKPVKLTCHILNGDKYKYGNPKYKIYYSDRLLESSTEVCIIKPNTECNQAGWPTGFWGSIASNVMYINYLSEMATIYSINSSGYKNSIEEYNQAINTLIKMSEDAELENAHDKKAEKIKKAEKYSSEMMGPYYEFTEKIEAEWNSYRNQLSEKSKSATPSISKEGAGCAGETPVALSFDEEPKYVGFISEFAWELCRVRGINPWDMNACVDWVSTRSETQRMSGRYILYIQWADKSEQTFHLDTTVIESDLPWKRPVIKFYKTKSATLSGGKEISSDILWRE